MVFRVLHGSPFLTRLCTLCLATWPRSCSRCPVSGLPTPPALQDVGLLCDHRLTPRTSPFLHPLCSHSCLR